MTFTHATTLEIRNQCPYTVWAAAMPGGGQQLNSGQTWSINVPSNTTSGRIWGRTNCNFNASGQGKCESGDCGGLLECQAYGNPPNTLVEYKLNQFSDMRDFFDISLFHGFNIPVDFRQTTGICRGVGCLADIIEHCPAELKVAGGCNDACTVFNTEEYCCNFGDCGPTNYSKFFKDWCPDAYTYSKPDELSTFACPTGPNYRVVFCPDSLRLIM
ncbi:hypothetical protein HHK36_000258 [Tetracentron sinense]|uniref:Thaumatin-like protein n=1 Tax=Tetracentron sinense TaxID=13715 RepID=A0A835A1B1_TETSI|nr:hypothetical protein HHK36_000258 [Tetracentron sinense]